METLKKNVRFEEFISPESDQDSTFDTADLVAAVNRYTSRRTTKVTSTLSASSLLHHQRFQLSSNDVKILRQIVQRCDAELDTVGNFPLVYSIYESVLRAHGLVSKENRFFQALVVISRLKGTSWADRFQSFIFRLSEKRTNKERSTYSEDGLLATSSEIERDFFLQWRKKYLKTRYEYLYINHYFATLEVTELKRNFLNLWATKLRENKGRLNNVQLARDKCVQIKAYLLWVSARRTSIELQQKAKIVDTQKLLKEVIFIWRENLKQKIYERKCQEFSRHHLLVKAITLWKVRHSYNEMLSKMIETSAETKHLGAFFTSWKLQSRLKKFRRDIYVKSVIQAFGKWIKHLNDIYQMQNTARRVYNERLQVKKTLMFVSSCKRIYQLMLVSSVLYEEKLMTHTLGMWKNNLILMRISHKFITTKNIAVMTNFFGIWRNMSLNYCNARDFSNYKAIKNTFHAWKLKKAEIICTGLVQYYLERTVLKKWQLFVKCNDFIKYRDSTHLSLNFSMWVNKTHYQQSHRSTMLHQFTIASKDRQLITFFKKWKRSYKLVRGKELLAKKYYTFFSKDAIFHLLLLKYTALLELRQLAVDQSTISCKKNHLNIWRISLQRNLDTKKLEEQAVLFYTEVALKKWLRFWRDVLHTKKNEKKLTSIAIAFNDKNIIQAAILYWKQRLRIKQAKNRNKILKNFLVSKKQETISAYFVKWQGAFHRYELKVEEADNYHEDNAKKIASLCLNYWISEARQVSINNIQAEEINNQNLKYHAFTIIQERYAFLENMTRGAREFFEAILSRRQERFYKLWAMKAFKLKNRLHQSDLFRERLEISKIRHIWRLWKLKAENTAYIKQVLLSPTKSGNLSSTRLVKRNQEKPQKSNGSYTPYSSNMERILEESPRGKFNIYDEEEGGFSDKRPLNANLATPYSRGLYTGDAISSNQSQNSNRLSSILQTPTRVKSHRLDPLSIERWKRSETNRFLNLRMNNESRFFVTDTDSDSTDSVVSSESSETTLRAKDSPLNTEGFSRLPLSSQVIEANIDYSNDPGYITPEMN
ncbi:hypothetical protein NADFUDRAFT_41716 [Nadsonia fulvescens var. elongata DSM 6958]|uniref:Sfi1 spindle body domain-containing protein n=1 Tax=Nadsonia fulvescens var. elongata DSM 6958 TaxID=857566 RepID=A0A1E3PJW5_9ASCO|nr:hypothetical protein NADFUDRAFT_41716 [Nadsonia fulvescens var. elongata DSM 6958]